MAKHFKTNLSNEVANFIRKKILVGAYEDESHLSESAIAEQLQVSRGPIREAIKQLEGEGFVYTPANGRTQVISFGDADFADYQQMRFYIECDACMKLIDQVQEDDDQPWLGTLHHLLDRIEAADRDGDDTVINECDYHFHDCIIHNAGSTILRCMWKSLSGIRRSIMETNRSFQSHMRHAPSALKAIHSRIFEEIVAGNREGLCRALQDHFRSGKQTFSIYRAGKGKSYSAKK